MSDNQNNGIFTDDELMELRRVDLDNIDSIDELITRFNNLIDQQMGNSNIDTDDQIFQVNLRVNIIRRIRNNENNLDDMLTEIRNAQQ
jgi:hypothetical protein